MTDTITTAELHDVALFDEIDLLVVRIKVEKDARKFLVEKLAKQDRDIEKLRLKLAEKTTRFQTLARQTV